MYTRESPYTRALVLSERRSHRPQWRVAAALANRAVSQFDAAPKEMQLAATLVALVAATRGASDGAAATLAALATPPPRAAPSPVEAIADAVAAFNAAASARWPAPPRTRAAVVLSGHLRTGAIEAVAANTRKAILEPLDGPDLFWLAAEPAAAAARLVPTALKRWRTVLRRADVALADQRAFRAIERNCSATRDATASDVALRDSPGCNQTS